MGAFLLWAHRGDLNLRRSERKENAERFQRAGESAGRRAKPVRIREADTRTSFRPHH